MCDVVAVAVADPGDTLLMSLEGQRHTSGVRRKQLLSALLVAFMC